MVPTIIPQHQDKDTFTRFVGDPDDCPPINAVVPFLEIIADIPLILDTEIVLMVLGVNLNQLSVSKIIG